MNHFEVHEREIEQRLLSLVLFWVLENKTFLPLCCSSPNTGSRVSFGSGKDSEDFGDFN